MEDSPAPNLKVGHEKRRLRDSKENFFFFSAKGPPRSPKHSDPLRVTCFQLAQEYMSVGGVKTADDPITIAIQKDDARNPPIPGPWVMMCVPP